MDRLRKRRDFLAAAKAERAGVSSVLMQGRDRGDDGPVRVGFTVTKKTGNAVIRNRIRRRLREAVRRVLPEAGRAGFDYVLVAREAALRTPFDGLVTEIERAVRKLHTPRSAKDVSRGEKDGSRRRDRRPSQGAATVPGATSNSASPGAIAPAAGRPLAGPPAADTSTPDPIPTARAPVDRSGSPILRNSADAADGDPPA
ncbi:ribonuclease P protein component [Xanthobacter sp. KR7-65]|uniref:ribonuclease P protein component n=1 Tax=Xanthobacter sp. KR7-65 TaxID=3156612 RepID=UPI0032B54C9E